MPTVSVKLTDATKQRVQSCAQSKGSTPHAIMVQAIEAALAQYDDQSQLIASALRARAQVVESSKVVDGRALSGYLKAKARGVPAKRPKSIDLTSVFPSNE